MSSTHYLRSDSHGNTNASIGNIRYCITRMNIDCDDKMDFARFSVLVETLTEICIVSAKKHTHKFFLSVFEGSMLRLGNVVYLKPLRFSATQSNHSVTVQKHRVHIQFMKNNEISVIITFSAEILIKYRKNCCGWVCKIDGWAE